MSKNISFSLMFLLFFSLALNAVASDMGMSIQLRLKSPGGIYPSETGVAIKIQVLSPVTGCILREENFLSQSITDGSVSLILGSGTVAGYDPGLTLNSALDNSTAKSGLTCVAANGSVSATAQTYTPAASDGRKIRFSAVVAGDPVLADFPLKSVAYAVQAESVGGKVASDILARNATTALSQTNLEALLADATKLSNLQNMANGGAAPSAINAINATNATTAVSFSGALAGDISGNQSTVSVDKIKGIPVSGVAPAAGQVLQYNGTQYAAVAIPSAPVASVAGRTGAVVLANSDISGLGTAAVLNSGTAANNLVQLDATAQIPAALLPTVASNSIADTTAATSLNTASTIVKRDASGNIAINSIAGINSTSQNIYVYETTNTNRVQIKAPAAFANYALTLPTGTGSAGQVLSTNGTGALSWAAPGGSGTVTNVSSANSYLTIASATTAPVITANVGTLANTLAAGNDSRIVGAFQSATALGGDLTGTLPNPVLASIVTAGSAAKITYDAKGRVTAGTTLVAADIPNISTTLLTAGTLPVARGGTGAATMTANALIMSDATGSALSGVTCAVNQVMYWTGTAWACVSVSSLLDATLGSSQGGIAYRGAAAWSTLAPGTSGQFLKTNGAAANPSWTSTSSFFAGNGSNTAVPAASTYIYPFSSTTPKTSVTTANHALSILAVPKAGTLNNLTVTFSAAAASTFKCTVYTGATTATMAASTLVVTGNGVATFLTSAVPVAVAAGTLFDLVCVNMAAAASVVPLAYSVEYTTP